MVTGLGSILFKENFFYNNPADEAYHTFAFVFLARPTSTALIDDALVEDGEAEKPRWFNIKDIHPADFQSFAEDVFAHFQEITAYTHHRST